MSLFIGNISKRLDPKEFDQKFQQYGKVKIDRRPGYAFVEYDDEYNAEQALKEMDKYSFSGLRINIEWSKRSGRYNPKESRRNRSRSRDRDRGYRGRYRTKPDYDEEENWSYSLSLSPEKYQKKKPEEEEDEKAKEKIEVKEEGEKGGEKVKDEAKEKSQKGGVVPRELEEGEIAEIGEIKVKKE